MCIVPDGQQGGYFSESEQGGGGGGEVSDSYSEVRHNIRSLLQVCLLERENLVGKHCLDPEVQPCDVDNQGRIVSNDDWEAEPIAVRTRGKRVAVKTEEGQAAQGTEKEKEKEKDGKARSGKEKKGVVSEEGSSIRVSWCACGDTAS